MDYPTGKNARKRWFYTIGNGCESNSNRAPDCSRAKVFLYEKLYKSITQHDLIECYKLLQVLPKDTSLDPYILLRFVLILIESVHTDRVNKNFIIYLESIMSKLDLTKPDAFLEYVSYFIKHNRIDDARELFSQRLRIMTNLTHRKVPFVDINIRCYEFLMNYLAWENRISNEQKAITFDVSIQGWLVNAIDQLKEVTGNYEYFVMCITRVLMAYGFHKKAYLFVSEFQINNPENIGAQLLLFNLLAKLRSLNEENRLQSKENRNQIDDSMDCDVNDYDDHEADLVDYDQTSMQTLRQNELAAINNFVLDEQEESIDFQCYPIVGHKNEILINLRSLDKTRDEILELHYQLAGHRVDLIRDLMDSLEYKKHVTDSTRWKHLKRILINTIDSGDEQALAEIGHLWQTRYQRFWTSVDFLCLVEEAGSSSSSSLRRAVKKVLKLLRANFNNGHHHHQTMDVELGPTTEIDDRNEFEFLREV